jgi:hypothetical protein
MAPSRIAARSAGPRRQTRCIMGEGEALAEELKVSELPLLAATATSVFTRLPWSRTAAELEVRAGENPSFHRPGRRVGPPSDHSPGQPRRVMPNACGNTGVPRLVS